MFDRYGMDRNKIRRTAFSERNQYQVSSNPFQKVRRWNTRADSHTDRRTGKHNLSNMWR
jgi:hypothetical protein